MKEAVKDATIFHDRLDDVLEEIPHALADGLLVVDQLTETSQTLICALSAVIV